MRSRVYLAPELVLSLGSGRYEIVAHPVPPDAVVVGFGYDMNGTGHLYLEFEASGRLPVEWPAPVVRRLEDVETCAHCVAIDRERLGTDSAPQARMAGHWPSCAAYPAIARDRVRAAATPPIT